MKKIILSNILNPQTKNKCEFIQNAALILTKKKNGSYIVEKYGKIEKLLPEIEGEVINLLDSVLMPSFFDMHFHWVQDDVRSMPKASLLEWLENYTFPTEEKFRNKQFAKKKAKSFFRKLISTGTLGGAVYSSIHEHALHFAMEEVLGDFVIGNVQMTINSPKGLTQKSKDAIELSARLSKQYKKRYALTPRFAIATDPYTMKESVKLSRKNQSFIQTHLSENTSEIEFVNSLYQNEMKGFKDVKNYTEIYKKVGLLGKKTIMGHGIYLSAQELKLLKDTGTSIAHCPTSNAPHKEQGLGSGLFNFKKVNRYKIPWALGSDIGGGPFLSMFDVMRSFKEQNAKAGIEATYVEALYRSTLAGAKILEMDKSKGNLNAKKEANFICVKAPNILTNTSAEEVLHKIIAPFRKKRELYDKLCTHVFYKGKMVFKQSSP